MALLHLMARVARERGVNLRAVTVDHGLRPEARGEADFVAQACARLNVPHDTLTWSHRALKGNLQDQARRARYRLIADWAKAHKVTHVAIGHTADDQAETLLIELAREAGLDGLSGMRPRWQQHDTTWVRPLLVHIRAELRSYLMRHDEKWIDDPSNDDERFTRIKARKLLEALEPLGITSKGLSGVAQNLLPVRQAIDASVAKTAADISREVAGEVIIDRDKLSEANPEIARRLLLGALKWVSGSEYPPRSESQNRLAAAIAQGRTVTLSGCYIRIKKKEIYISREHKAVKDIKGAVTDIWDKKWRFTGPADAGFEVRILGAEGLKCCENWRETGASRHALIVSPALWHKGRLVAAPLAGMANEWVLEAVRPYYDVFTCH